MLLSDGQDPPSSSSPGLCAGLWAVEAPASGRCTKMEAVMSKTQSTATQLSDSQLVILAAAAQRDDGSLLPIPQSLTAKGAALSKVVETLCKRKLAEERRSINGAAEWRRDEENRSLGLFITSGGLLALGLDDTERKTSSQVTASIPPQRKTAAARPRGKPRKASPASPKQRGARSQSKQDLVIQMLRRLSGVTIDDIIAKTGWQPHSVRGFFSGTREKEAQAAPRLRGRQGRRAPLSHRPDRIRQGVSHGAASGASPAPPKAARPILSPIRARIESLGYRTGSRLGRLRP